MGLRAPEVSALGQHRGIGWGGIWDEGVQDEGDTCISMATHIGKKNKNKSRTSVFHPS